MIILQGKKILVWTEKLFLRSHVPRQGYIPLCHHCWVSLIVLKMASVTKSLFLEILVWTLWLMHRCVCIWLYICPLCHVCIALFLPPVGVNRSWRDGWMTRWMDGWNDASRRPLLCPLHCVFIPLFLHPVGVNRPWWDKWMIERTDIWMMGQMDEMMLHDILYYM